jgi:hypothetical protein
MQTDEAWNAGEGSLLHYTTNNTKASRDGGLFLF